jgi:hypothetical protein
VVNNLFADSIGHRIKKLVKKPDAAPTLLFFETYQVELYYLFLYSACDSLRLTANFSLSTFFRTVFFVGRFRKIIKSVQRQAF